MGRVINYGDLDRRTKSKLKKAGYKPDESGKTATRGGTSGRRRTGGSGTPIEATPRAQKILEEIEHPDAKKTVVVQPEPKKQQQQKPKKQQQQKSKVGKWDDIAEMNRRIRAEKAAQARRDKQAEQITRRTEFEKDVAAQERRNRRLDPYRQNVADTAAIWTNPENIKPAVKYWFTKDPRYLEDFKPAKDRSKAGEFVQGRAHTALGMAAGVVDIIPAVNKEYIIAKHKKEIDKTELSMERDRAMLQGADAALYKKDKRTGKKSFRWEVFVDAATLGLLMTGEGSTATEVVGRGTLERTTSRGTRQTLRFEETAPKPETPRPRPRATEPPRPGFRPRATEPPRPRSNPMKDAFNKAKDAFKRTKDTGKAKASEIAKSGKDVAKRASDIAKRPGRRTRTKPPALKTQYIEPAKPRYEPPKPKGENPLTNKGKGGGGPPAEPPVKPNPIRPWTGDLVPKTTTITPPKANNVVVRRGGPPKQPSRPRGSRGGSMKGGGGAGFPPFGWGGLNFDFPSGGGILSRGKPYGRARRKKGKGYMPSVAAIAFSIKGKRPKKTTGLEFRPL